MHLAISLDLGQSLALPILDQILLRDLGLPHLPAYLHHPRQCSDTRSTKKSSPVSSSSAWKLKKSSLILLSSLQVSRQYTQSPTSPNNQIDIHSIKPSSLLDHPEPTSHVPQMRFFEAREAANAFLQKMVVSETFSSIMMAWR